MIEPGNEAKLHTSLDRFMPKRIFGVTKLRNMTADEFWSLTEPVLIRKNEEPIAVLMPAALFMDMQRLIFDLEKTLAESSGG